MTDIKKVIEWSEKCTSSVHESEDCNGCPYHLEHEGFYSCIECLLMDTVALLKEQEAVGPKIGHWIESKCLDECFWVCSECNFQSEAIAAPKLYKYCPNCGTKMEGQAVMLE